MKASTAELKAAFAEWDRRYRENPEHFMDEVTHLLKNGSASYGDACGAYFEQLVAEMKKGRQQ